MLAFLLATYLLFHIGDTHCVNVDILETNHVYNKDGAYIFTQVIAWKIMPEDGRMHNLGWKMVKANFDYPIKANKIWYLKLSDRLIKADQHLERWLNFDIERADSSEYWRGNPPNVFEQPLNTPVKFDDDS